MKVLRGLEWVILRERISRPFYQHGVDLEPFCYRDELGPLENEVFSMEKLSGEYLAMVSALYMFAIRFMKRK